MWINQRGAFATLHTERRSGDFVPQIAGHVWPQAGQEAQRRRPDLKVEDVSSAFSEANVLKAPLPAGEERSLDVLGDYNCLADVEAVYAGDKKEIHRKINICTRQRVVFTGRD